MEGGNVARGELRCGVDAVLPGEAWSGGDKLEKSSSMTEVVKQAVHQLQVIAHLVKEVVCSLVLEICLGRRWLCVEWVSANVLGDQEKEVH